MRIDANGMNMSAYASPNPADSHPHLPSTVVMKYLKRSQATSESTGPTYIDTSPLSAEDYSPLHRSGYEQRRTHHVYNGSHHMPGAIMTKKKDRKRETRQHEANHVHYDPGLMFNERRKHDTGRQGPASVGTTDHTLKHRKDGNDNPSSEYHNTLSWRMDPSISLSDFTLTVIGISDKDAVEKHCSAKNERRKKKQSRRKDKWMVEGLFLDMSDSDSQESEDEERRSAAEEEDRGRDQEHRSDDVRVHSTPSGTKVSNYPVVKRYHLHKVNLAVGARSCDHFARLFHKDSNVSDHSIEMPLSCLPAIPAMLDYLYHPDPTIPVFATTGTATSLRYLGTLLGNRSLFESATRYLQTDLCPKSAIEYLQHAELYHQKKLADVCVRICAESFDVLKITWFASLKPHLMKRILHSRHFAQPSDGASVCSKIASYCRCQLHKIDRRMLLALTDAKVMPIVCPREALFYIQIMIRLGMDMDNGGRDDGLSCKERNLYERCVDAAPVVVQGVIDSLSHGDDSGHMGMPGYGNRPSRQAKSACGDYSRLPPQVKVDLLEYALARQQQKRGR